MFLPTTTGELKQRGWSRLDVILVTGDAYIDSPHIGVAVIGRLLEREGFRVGIIAQPDVESASDIMRLGEPCLFWGVTGGCLDSMVANYTALGKKRHSDDLTPGGRNNRRPDRAVIAYANLIRRYFQNSRPLVLGGVEASLRRIAHYDYWSDSVRRSILLDARADILAYGMAERAVLEIAQRLAAGKDIHNIHGTCLIAKEPPQGFLELPSFEVVAENHRALTEMFKIFCANNDPVTAKGLVQKHKDRYLVHYPPSPHLSTEELDRVYKPEYMRDAHPYYKKQGRILALDTIAFSLITHRGCFGECRFCSIALHEGRTVISRSEESVLEEARKIAALPDFKGYLSDVGGATANMYGMSCARPSVSGACAGKRCLYPRICPSLKVDHFRQIQLLRNLRRIPGVKKAFVTSGIRHDLILADKKNGLSYLREVVKYHVSGQMKIAPEHVSLDVLNLMGKPSSLALLHFQSLFEKMNKEEKLKQFLTYYFLAAHPGCREEDMRELKIFASRELRTTPQQVQIFTPLPSTWSALAYRTGTDPSTGRKIYVERDLIKKQKQKDMVTGGRRKKQAGPRQSLKKQPFNRRKIALHKKTE